MFILVYSKKILVFGGGRWARQYILTLDRILDREYEVLICTNNRSEMFAFLNELRGGLKFKFIDRSEIFKETGIVFACVVNSTRDHISDVELCLELGIDVIVEKPLTMDLNSSLELVALAAKTKTRLMHSNLFLFNPSLKKFQQYNVNKMKMTYATINWQDPILEIRYGERKVIDRTIDVLTDLMPHIFSIINFEMNWRDSIHVEGVGFIEHKRAHLSLRKDDLTYELDIDQAGASRVRRLDYFTEREDPTRTSSLDFSSHPASVLRCDDQNYFLTGARTSDKMPLELMLRAVLTVTDGNLTDERLSPTVDLEAKKLLNQIRLTWGKDS